MAILPALSSDERRRRDEPSAADAERRSPVAAAEPRGGATDGARPSEREQVVVITGLSGAGKSQASKLFEDFGFYCVDNLPPELLDSFLGLREREPKRYRRAALVVDIRAGDPAPAIERAVEELTARRVPVEVVYLEADDASLVARYSETRHLHPLASPHGVYASIAEERRALDAARRLATAVIDTSGLSIGQLRERLLPLVGDAGAAGEFAITLITFGFKFGLPLDADLIFDVRFLTTPHYVPGLRPLSGLRREVSEYVLKQPAAARFLDLVEQLVDLTRPAYLAEGKSRLTIALGCTGGYHRSIALAEELAARLRRAERGSVSVYHRELDR